MVPPMPLFRYEARDKQGREVAGQVEAPNRVGASLKLRQEDLWITRLEPASGGQVENAAVAPQDWWYSLRPLRPAHLRNFFDQLGELLQAGVNLYESMTELPNRVHRRLRPIVQKMASPLAAGEKFSDQLTRYPHIFSRATVGIIRAGERSGELAQMCRLLADEYQQDHRVWLALLYPRIYGSILIPLAILVPTLPGVISKGWAWYWHTLLTVLLPVIVALIILDWVIRYVLRQPWAAGARQNLLYFLPGLAGYIRSSLNHRVLTVLEAMIQSGASFGEALQVAAEAAGPGRLGRQLTQAAAKVEAGEPLGVALGDCSRLPYTVRSAMLTAEQAGAHEQTLGRLARAEREEMEAVPNKLALTGIFGGVALFGIIAFFAVLAGYLNYFNSVMEAGEQLMP